MSRVELRADLDAVVTATIVRRWMDRAAPDLLTDVQRGCPPARQWVTAHDERVRAAHAKAGGQTIPGNLRFVLDKPQAGPTATGQASRAAHHAEGHGGGQAGTIARKPQQAGTEMARYPRDPDLSAGNAVNCRCSAVTIAGLIAATMMLTDIEVAGPVARFEVSSRFPRIAESEFGDGTDPGLHFMARALTALAGRLNAAGR